MPRNPPKTEPELRALLEQVACSMIDRPDDLVVEVVPSDEIVMVKIRVHDSDVGKMLGIRGAHARALETVFAAAYGKLGLQLVLKVITPNRRRR